jgi:hypothetical protein
MVFETSFRSHEARCSERVAGSEHVEGKRAAVV